VLVKRTQQQSHLATDANNKTTNSI